MPTPMFRGFDSESVILGTTLQASTPIHMSQAAALSVLVGTLPAPTTIQWYGSANEDGPYYRIVTTEGLEAATTVANGDRAYIGPLDLYACSYVKGVVTGTALTVTCMKKT